MSSSLSNDVPLNDDAANTNTNDSVSFIGLNIYLALIFIASVGLNEVMLMECFDWSMQVFCFKIGWWKSGKGRFLLVKKSNGFKLNLLNFLNLIN